MFTKEENEVFDRILEARYSCRRFTEELPERFEVESIIEAGRSAPYASISSKDVIPFRHFYVMFKGDKRYPLIDILIRDQSAADLEAVRSEAENNSFLKEHLAGLDRLWSKAAKDGVHFFPDPPCLVIAAEWMGARRGHRQSLAHMMQNMWLKATALNLGLGIISAIESMTDNEGFCSIFGLPTGRYGFLGCVIGHSNEEPRPSHHCTSETHWL